MSPQPRRSDTKTRILATALSLFNTEGEGEISTVDIAAVMGISPGNLYYHYKGKDAIVAALFDDFETEIRQVLDAPVTRPLALEDNWIYLHIIFEEIWDFRFFYRDPHGLTAGDSALAARFRRLLALKETTAGALLRELERLGVLEFADTERQNLAMRLARHFTLWLSYAALRDPKNDDATATIEAGVFDAILQITPYLRRDADGFVAELEAFAQGRV